jgi:ribonuclease HI
MWTVSTLPGFDPCDQLAQGGRDVRRRAFWDGPHISPRDCAVLNLTELLKSMNTNLTFDGYHLPTIARLCKELGSPTQGQLAEFVWRLSNFAALPFAVAEEFMRSAGYIPFKGYPLTLAGSPNASCVLATDGTVTAWTDGGSRGNPGPSAYAVVFKDSKGQRLAVLSNFLGDQTNNVAEYQGLLAALAYAIQAGYKKLQVLSDSELMVRQFQGHYRVRDKQLSILHATAVNQIHKFERFSIRHIDRSCNTEADTLVNQTLNHRQRLR